MNEPPLWAKRLGDEELRRSELEYRSGARGDLESPQTQAELSGLRFLMKERGVQPYNFDDLEAHFDEVARITKGLT